MRVATRRLRAFLRAGHDLLDPEWSEPLREELRWLGSALGPVRDLDVLLEHLSGEVESLGEDAPEGRKLLARLGREHRTARRTLLAVLDSDRYFALLEALEGAGRDDRRRAVARRRSTRPSTNGCARPSAPSVPSRRTTSCTRCGSRSSARATPPSSRTGRRTSRPRSPSRTCSASTRTPSSRESGCGRSWRGCPTPPWPPGGCSNASGRGHEESRDEWEAAWKRLAKTA